jgi:transcriptional repressor of dcmA and dcmR
MPRRRNEDPDLLDIQQAARLLNVSETSLRRWTNTGKLVCLRVGPRRERRFRRGDLLAFLEMPSPSQGLDRENAGTDTVAGIPLALGTHLCSLHTSARGQARLAAGFLGDGPRDGVVYLLAGSAEGNRAVLAQLERHHPGVSADVFAGRLELAEIGARFQDHLESLEARLHAAQRRGARAFRLVGAPLDGKGTKWPEGAVLAYEDAYDRVIAKRFPVITLCQYDVRRSSGTEVLELLRRHPDVFAYPRDRMLA